MLASSLQEDFRLVLLTVVGQAFTAAGYALVEAPILWAGGLFRFVRPLGDASALPAPPDGGAWHGVIDFQLLRAVELRPGRFRVQLTRAASQDPNATCAHPGCVRRTLSALVVEDFAVRILPSADHWWSYRETSELGRALGEAGSLAIGYGMPWLSGELAP